MAENEKKKWEAGGGDVSSGLSEADAAFAAPPPPPSSAKHGGDDEVSQDRDASAQSAAEREQSFQADNLADRARSSKAGAGEEGPDASPPQLQAAAQAVDTVKAVGGPAAEAAVKKAQDRFRWWIWGAIILGSETIVISILGILALDILYIGQKYFPSLRRFVPKPYIYEIIALIVLSTFLALLVGAVLVVQMMPIFLFMGAIDKIPGAKWLFEHFVL